MTVTIYNETPYTYYIATKIDGVCLHNGDVDVEDRSISYAPWDTRPVDLCASCGVEL